jgi:hypothetical protein
LASHTFQLWAYFVYFAWAWLALLQGDHCRANTLFNIFSRFCPLAFSRPVSY